MLSEQVLENLARNAPLRQHLIEAAWPDLSVESKLQVIQAVQSDSYKNETPTWLMQVCIEDSAPIVRYWAARYYFFADENLQNWPFPGGPPQVVPEVEKELRKTALADTSELVRACIFDSDKRLTERSQLERLVYLRSSGTAHVVGFLSKGVDAGVSDEELTDCLREVFEKPGVLADLESDINYREGDTAYYEGQVVTDGWETLRKSGPKLAHLLAWRLPTSRGLSSVSPDTIASMPLHVLEALAYRANKPKAVETALQMVTNNPQKYGEASVKAINDAFAFSASIGESDSAPNTFETDRAEETLQALEALSNQVRAQSVQLEAVQRQVAAKRGLIF